MSDKNLQAIADFYKADLKSVELADFFNERFLQGKFFNRKGRFLSVLKDKSMYKEICLFHLDKNKIHRVVFYKKIMPSKLYDKNKIRRANLFRIVFLEIIQCLEFINKYGLEQIPHSKIQNRVLKKNKGI